MRHGAAAICPDSTDLDSPPGSAPAAVHDAVRSFCTALLQRVVFHVPDPEAPGSDRTTFVTLTPEDEALAIARQMSYRSWLERFLESRRSLLAPPEVNLLRATGEEIQTYIRMGRRAQDLTPDLYVRLCILELDNLLSTQQNICAGALDALNATAVARRRRYWRNVPLNLGVEEEYQIVSTDTWQLQSDVDVVLENARPRTGTVTREVYQSQVEISTAVCADVHELATAIADARHTVSGALPAHLAVLSAATHPFDVWNTQQANKSARTDMFMHDMQDVVRRLVTFGLHVHVGIDDPELALETMNAVRRYLPLLLALSASSPFWEGRLTGLMSYRSTVFSVLPRTGIPPAFENRHELDAYFQLLAATRSFDSLGNFDATKVWWDVRLHPRYPTLEIRVCDACPSQADTVTIAALCQALVAKITKLRHQGLQPMVQKKYITEENKWRAIRYGRRARFIDDIRGVEVPAAYHAREVLDFVDDVLDDLGSRSEVERILTILKDGTGADLQLDTFRETGDLAAVVRRLAAEFTVTNATYA
jgi:glutamate---cysteine ligase / carboxylate-amine ligase